MARLDETNIQNFDSKPIFIGTTIGKEIGTQIGEKL